MAKRVFWQRPQLRTDEEQELDRRVTWLELFFDLFIVVVVSQFSHKLAYDVTWLGVGKFIFLFMHLWWAWIGATYYIERFETDGLDQRIFTFLQMIPLAGMAIFAHRAFSTMSVEFALCYALSRVIITYLWWRGGRYDSCFRPTAQRFVMGFSLSILMFVGSVFVAPPFRFVMWGLGLFIDLITPLFTARLQAQLPRFSTSKLPERFGLFVIIVLGESIMGVVNGLAKREKLDLIDAMVGVLAIAIAFCMWWIYFDFVSRRPPKRSSGWAFAWGYLHLPLIISITATGAGILNVVADKDLRLDSNVGLLIGSSVGISLIAIGFLELTLQRTAYEPTHPRLSPGLKFGAGAIAIAFGAISSGIWAIGLQLSLLALLMMQVGYGLYIWFTQDLTDIQLEEHLEEEHFEIGSSMQSDNSPQ